MTDQYLNTMRKRGELYFANECPGCGWNATSENGVAEGFCEVIDSKETKTDWGPGFEILIKCTCPTCGTEFEYNDGSP